jgi:ABC-type lipoprotein export system ATPase subunit
VNEPAFFQAADVGKTFHAGTDAEVRALDGVTLSIGRGAFTLLTGPSGGGKTTLLALLGALERPTRGAVAVDGVDPAGLSEAARSKLRRRFGFAFPGGQMIPTLPLWENVTLGLVPVGRGVAERRRTAQEALDRVGLSAKLRAAPEELSTGELNRAGLARALAAAPEILLVDEPLANLDPATRGLIVEVLGAEGRRGATVLVASHLVDQFPAAGEVVRLEGGRRV